MTNQADAKEQHSISDVLYIRSLCRTIRTCINLRKFCDYTYPWIYPISKKLWYSEIRNSDMYRFLGQHDAVLHRWEVKVFWNNVAFIFIGNLHFRHSSIKRFSIKFKLEKLSTMTHFIGSWWEKSRILNK